MARDLIEIAGSGEDSIPIAIEEVADADWTDQVWRPRIAPKLGTLHLEPGYRPPE